MHYPMHYHVGHNTPGSPEADIYCTGLVEDAAQTFYDLLQDAANDESVTDKCYEAAQSYLNEWAPTRIENQLAVRPTDGGFCFDVWEVDRSLPVRYWLELATGNAGDCDWRDPSAI